MALCQVHNVRSHLTLDFSRNWPRIGKQIRLDVCGKVEAWARDLGDSLRLEAFIATSRARLR